jgi:PAS domain S-box-containing protein
MEERVKVLLVEDDPASARLIRELFRDLPGNPFDVHHVDHLASALNHAEGTDIVLLDLMLPDSAGLETVKKFVGAHPTLPVVVLTTLNDDQTGVAAVQAGAQDYLFKGEVEGPLLARALRYAMERRRIQSALRESENRYRTIFEAAGTPMAILEENLTIALVNQEFERTFRQPKGEVEGHWKWKDLVTRDEQQRTEHYLEIRKENPQAELAPHECRLKDKNGYIHDFLVSISPVPSSTRSILSLLDISEMRRLEKQEKQHIRTQSFLASSAMRFVQAPSTEVLFKEVGRLLHQLFKRSLVIVCVREEGSLKFRILSVIGGKKGLHREEAEKKILEGVLFCISPLLQRKCKRGTIERVRGGFASIATGDLPPPLQALLKETIGRGDLHTVGFSREDEILGFALLVTEKGAPLRNSQVIKTLIHQASNAIRRKQAEEELVSVRSRLQYVMESTPGVIYAAELQHDDTPIYTYISENIRGFLGYDVQDVLHDRQFWHRRVHAADLDEYSQQAIPLLFEKGAVAAEYRLKSKHGTYKWIYDGMKLVEGKGRAVVGFWMDITERKHMEEALLIKHNAIESLGVPLLLTDLEMQVVYANGSALSAWGYQSGDQVVGRALSHMIGPQTRWKEVSSHLAQMGEWSGEVRCRRSDGSRFDAWLTVSKVQEAQELPCYVLAIYDLTEQKRVEREVQRLRTVLEGVLHNERPFSSSVVEKTAGDKKQTVPRTKRKLSPKTSK